MKKHGTYLVPTMYLQDWFLENAERLHVPDYAIAKARDIFPIARKNLAHAFASGVKVALGTDAAVYQHGLNARELAVYVRLGMTPLQALQSATINAADLLGWKDKVGAVEAGQVGGPRRGGGRSTRDVTTPRAGQVRDEGRARRRVAGRTVNGSLARTRGVVDFLLRLAFFAAAPFASSSSPRSSPVSGALVQVGLGLGAFFAGEALRRWSSRSKLVRLALSSQLEFEAYYRAHPPRAFLYYVFYPLLAPYWLFAREARREFLLFKGYTLASFALLVELAGGAVRAVLPPRGLTVTRLPAPSRAARSSVETAVVLMFLMPIVTSVVRFHPIRAPWRRWPCSCSSGSRR